MKHVRTILESRECGTIRYRILALTSQILIEIFMEETKMAKTLIAFFSRADENYFGGAMRYVKVGNTEIVVNQMKELIDADTFKIEMLNPYSPVYMTCIDEAKKDLRENARPELTNYFDSIRDYKRIFLAFDRAINHRFFVFGIESTVL